MTEKEIFTQLSSIKEYLKELGNKYKSSSLLNMSEDIEQVYNKFNNIYYHVLWDNRYLDVFQFEDDAIKYKQEQAKILAHPELLKIEIEIIE